MLTSPAGKATLALLMAVSLGAGAAWAEKPEWAGGRDRGDGPPGQMKKQRDERGARAHRGDDNGRVF